MFKMKCKLAQYLVTCPRQKTLQELQYGVDKNLQDNPLDFISYWRKRLAPSMRRFPGRLSYCLAPKVLLQFGRCEKLKSGQKSTLKAPPCIKKLESRLLLTAHNFVQGRLLELNLNSR
jgi:hypothetical protein